MFRPDSLRRSLVLAFAGTIAACTSDAPAPIEPESDAAFSVATAPALEYDAIQQNLANINAQLASNGASFVVERVELSLAPNADPASPNLIFAFDRTLRLPSRWVPGDARRFADGDNLTFANFVPLMIANGATPGEAAIDAAFATWNGVQCSNLPLVKRVLPGNIFPSAILGFSGLANDPFAADIATIGFVPGFIFDLVLGPGTSSSVLGVTFTFVFVKFAGGPPSDIDNNQRTDTAIKEIWYNDAFLWTNSGGAGTDIETVALHEEGHALELGHFGRVVVNTRKNTLNVSPRAVMNAFILGALRQPLGTDNSAYCSNWANWPN